MPLVAGEPKGSSDGHLVLGLVFGHMPNYAKALISSAAPPGC